MSTESTMRRAGRLLGFLVVAVALASLAACGASDPDGAATTVAETPTTGNGSGIEAEADDPAADESDEDSTGDVVGEPEASPTPAAVVATPEPTAAPEPLEDPVYEGAAIDLVPDTAAVFTRTAIAMGGSEPVDLEELLIPCSEAVAISSGAMTLGFGAPLIATSVFPTRDEASAALDRLADVVPGCEYEVLAGQVSSVISVRPGELTGRPAVRLLVDSGTSLDQQFVLVGNVIVAFAWVADGDDDWPDDELAFLVDLVVERMSGAESPVAGVAPLSARLPASPDGSEWTDQDDYPDSGQTARAIVRSSGAPESLMYAAYATIDERDEADPLVVVQFVFDDPAIAQATLDSQLADRGEPDRIDDVTGASIYQTNPIVGGETRDALDYWFVDGRGSLYWTRLIVRDSPRLGDDPEAYVQSVVEALIDDA